MSTFLNPFYLGDVITGEPRVKWSAEAAATHARWSRYRLAGSAVALAMIAIPPAFSRNSAGVPTQAVENAATPAVCARWDGIAKAALIAAIRDGRDRGLPQTGDPLAQLRRARHDCRMARLEIACLEFNAIAQGAARFQPAGADAPIACDALGSGADQRIAGVLEGK